MPIDEQQARLEEAFDRIEETILPCIAMMLETLLEASEGVAHTDPKALAAELQTLAAELEELTSQLGIRASKGHQVALIVTPETVRSHVKGIFRRLNVRSREEAAAVACRLRGLAP